MNTVKWRQWWLVTLLVGVIVVVLTGTAVAARFEGDDKVFRLPAGEEIDDDLYVSAEEIYIDGTVKGDLIAAGGYIEVNGVVTGDVMAAGGGIRVNGNVEDDVRVAGAGIDVAATIGGDLLVAGGGTPGFSFPIQMGSQSISQGVRIANGSQVAGDAAIVGGMGRIGGRIGGDLFSAMGTIALDAQIGGNADISAEDIRIGEGSQIAGTLRYSSEKESDIPTGAAERIEFNQIVREAAAVSTVSLILSWVLRTVLILIGFALLGWLVLHFAPHLITRSADAIRANPVEAGIYGLIGAVIFIFIPIASAILIFLVGLFWGIFPAVVAFFFLFAALFLIWLFSPLVTGLWLGQQIIDRLSGVSGLLPAFLIGALVLVVLGRIQCLGWIVYLLSFVLAVGGLIRAGRGRDGDVTPLEMPMPSELPASSS